MSIFGSYYPPGAANHPHAPYNEQIPPDSFFTAQNNTRRIFCRYGAKNWGDVDRMLYKHSVCGLSIGVQCDDGERPHYGHNLYKLTAESPAVLVLVSSIVEGVEQTTDTVEVDLTKRGTRKTGTILARLDAAVAIVEQQARRIWMNTHGCESCKRHWCKVGKTFLDSCPDGLTPVWLKCRKCNGRGIVI